MKYLIMIGCVILTGCGATLYHPKTQEGLECKMACSKAEMNCTSVQSGPCYHGAADCYNSCAEMERMKGGTK